MYEYYSTRYAWVCILISNNYECITFNYIKPWTVYIILLLFLNPCGTLYVRGTIILAYNESYMYYTCSYLILFFAYNIHLFLKLFKHREHYEIIHANYYLFKHKKSLKLCIMVISFVHLYI